MQLSVKGKQIDVGDALRQHVGDVLESVVEKYFGRAIEAHVAFSREAHLLRSDISVHVHRDLIVQGHALAADAYAAFDNAAEHIAKRIRRHKRRVQDHRVRLPGAGGEDSGEGSGGDGAEPVAESMSARSYILAEQGEEGGEATVEGDQPVIIAEMTCDIPTLTVGEAVMHMDLADVVSFIFRNRAHGGINVVYRRNDGHIGWVDPDHSGLSVSGKHRS